MHPENGETTEPNKNCSPLRKSLKDMEHMHRLPDDAVYAGNSASAPKATVNSREQGSSSVSSKTLGKCVKLNLHELRSEACCCHCRMTEACHVDELISSWQREAAHHFPRDRIIAPDVADKSLEEVELGARHNRSRPGRDGFAVQWLRPEGSQSRFVLSQSLSQQHPRRSRRRLTSRPLTTFLWQGKNFGWPSSNGA